MSGPTIEIGPYVVGEIPVPLEYQFLDSTGAPINLTGYTVRFQRGEIDGGFINATTVNATLSDATNGKVTYTWTSADFPHPGRFGGMFFVGNGTNRYASWLITWTTCASVDTPPNI
jgi:hypothetical protein